MRAGIRERKEREKEEERERERMIEAGRENSVYNTLYIC